MDTRGTYDFQENFAKTGTVIRDFCNELLRGCVERCLTTTGCTQFTWRAFNGLCLLRTDVISSRETSFFQNLFFSSPDEYCISGSVVVSHSHQVNKLLICIFIVENVQLFTFDKKDNII